MIRPEFEYDVVRRHHTMLLREAARERLARQVPPSDHPRVPAGRTLSMLALVAGLAGFAAVVAR